MKDDLIEFLKKFDTGNIPNSLAQNQPGFNRALESGAIKKQGNNAWDMYVMTASGYDLLQRWYVLDETKKLKEAIKNFDESSTKLSNENVKYAKQMNALTWWILIFTVANLVSIIIQIYLVVVVHK